MTKLILLSITILLIIAGGAAVLKSGTDSIQGYKDRVDSQQADLYNF